MPFLFHSIITRRSVSGVIRKMITARRSQTIGSTVVRISPFGRPPSNSDPRPEPSRGEFQGNNQKGKQPAVFVTFDKPVDFVEIISRSSNKNNNKFIAYDKNGRELVRVLFPNGNVRFGSDRRYNKASLKAKGIRKIELRPAGKEGHIFYGDMRFREEPVAVEKIVVKDPPPDIDPVSIPSIPKDVTILIPLQIRNQTVPLSKQHSIVVKFENKPAIPLFTRAPVEDDSTLAVRPMPIDMEQAIDNIAQAFTSAAVNDFFDDSRTLKTVLNFGDNFQTLLANWIKDPNNREDNSFLVKLYQPLPSNINIKELVWIDREISPTWTDSLFVTVAEPQEIIFFLRPPNKSSQRSLGLFGREVSNVTMDALLPSGSVQTVGSTVVLEDPTLREFFTTDIAGIELNVDYTAYNNFVHFSSAENRLIVFREKLSQIETLDTNLELQSTASAAALDSGLSDISGTSQFNAMVELVETREDIIRGFDGYERFLFYETGSFSGSLSGLSEDPVITRDDVSWPKDSEGVVLAVSSSEAVAYFDNQSVLGFDYDCANQEMLRNNIPHYLQDDAESAEFLTFLNMIGHLWDTIKLYIDDMPVIYDRDPSPDRGIPNDLLWHIAKSMGIDLPNQYSIKELVDFAVGDASATQATYKQAISETWKRFIHNQIFLAKTKGTRTGLQALLNTYGIQPEIIRVRETGTPSPIFTTGSFETFTELTKVLGFASGASVTIPWIDTGLFSPSTIECRFATAIGSFVPSMIMQGQTGSVANWSLVLVPTGSEINDRGQLVLFDSAGATVAASGVDKFYNGEFYTVMLRQGSESSSVDFQVKRFDDDVFEFEFSTSVTSSFTSSFRSGEIRLGSSATGSNDMRVDEFRLWNELTTDETFAFHAQFPGMYAGNDNESANQSLIFRHSFGVPQDLDSNPSVPNESPFVNSGTVDLILTSSFAAGFPEQIIFPFQYIRVERETKRFTPNAGGSQFTSAKITIAPSASFRSDALVVTGSSVFPVLNRNRSAVKTMMDREDAIKADSRVGLYFTLAETINDSILRSLGTIDINDLIGDPANLFEEEYRDLIDLNVFYNRSYAPAFDQNLFIRSVENLLDGLFDHAQQLVSVGTKLITGIVVEPTILERSKVKLNEPLGLEGAGTRNEANARQILAASGSYPSTRNVDMHVMNATSSIDAEDATLETLIDDASNLPVEAFITPLLADITAETASAFAEPAFVSAEIPLDDFAKVFGSNPQTEGSISLDETGQVIALLDPLTGKVILSASFGIEGEVPTTDMVVDADIFFTDITAAIEGDFNIPEIKSASDLDDIRNTTFFHLVSGTVGIVGFDKIRVRENLLNDRGEWVPNTTYVEDDVAIISGSQFRSLTSTTVAPDGTIVNFVSFISPDKDPTNWSPVAFTTVIVPRIFKAVVSGSSPVGTGSVAIVPFDQPGGVFIGYGPNHYRFSRPTYTAYVNARYFGVKQTIATTSDGRSPIEVLLSSDAQLFVKDGTPRQTVSDESGPILEVRPDEPDT